MPVTLILVFFFAVFQGLGKLKEEITRFDREKTEELKRLEEFKIQETKKLK